MSENKSVHELRFEMLSLLAKADRGYVELLRFFPDPSLAKNVLEHLIDDEYVSGRCESASILRLTRQGELELALLQDAAKQMAQKEAEERERQRSDDAKAVKNQKKQFRHDFAVAAFSVALTLLVEHFCEIVGFVVKLFRSLG